VFHIFASDCVSAVRVLYSCNSRLYILPLFVMIIDVVPASQASGVGTLSIGQNMIGECKVPHKVPWVGTQSIVVKSQKKKSNYSRRHDIAREISELAEKNCSFICSSVRPFICGTGYPRPSRNLTCLTYPTNPCPPQLLVNKFSETNNTHRHHIEPRRIRGPTHAHTLHQN